MMIKAGGTSVTINIFPGIDLDKLKQLETKDPILYEKINANMFRQSKSTSYNFGGAFNPDFEIAVRYAKNYVDEKLGTLDLNTLMK